MTANSEKSIEDRRHPLSDEEIDRLAHAITKKTHSDFRISDEKHYNSHQRLDKLLDAYDSATNIFAKTFFGLVIIGMIVLAGVTAVKGFK